MMTSASTVSSLDDLMGRCSVANERRLSQSARPDDIVLQLGLPFPGDVTNDELNQLKPLYMELINNIREAGEGSPYLQPLFETNIDLPDAAIILLYFLEYPNLVRAVRADVTNISECSVNEAFGFADIVDAIAVNSTIGRWCRNALASSEEHHFLVLASCISILDSIGRLPSDKDAKKYYKMIVLRRSSDAQEAFGELRLDLAKVVSRSDVSRDAVVNAILFQQHLVIRFFGEDESIAIMHRAPNKEAFESGLERHRNSFDANQYQFFRMLLGAPMSMQETATASGLPFQESRKEAIACEREGCNNPGTKLCKRCMLVAYCSRDCQVADWKPKHKVACKKGRKNTNAPSQTCTEEAASVARLMASPALHSQDLFLSQNPMVDYRIVLPTGNQDVGICFSHPMGKIMFQVLRSKARDSPYSVYRMYKMLQENRPRLQHIIRSQLQAEYGVDPLSDEAQHGDRIGISEEEMDDALQNLLL